LVKGSLPKDKFQDDNVIQFTLTDINGLETKEMSLRHGSNSTYAALNMAAVHLGFKNIFLLGVDLKWGQQGKRNTSHWHSQTPLQHKRIDPESVYFKMKEAYKTIAPPLKQLGVSVTNVNTPEKTAIDVFPIKSIQEVFQTK